MLTDFMPEDMQSRSQCNIEFEVLKENICTSTKKSITSADNFENKGEILFQTKKAENIF